uniref:Uncharacterized protein n=1 Tax=Alexandrium monilatum TaxID=311494 RepID=A0A7S4V6F9_9DINO|mmetsp:Transcript_87197/g.275369  ORF Transcript_87197/g.275369 Transcript_87197/m.275369 type:complete len:300 (+) Transcript_87197:39-938(+)
MSSETEPQVPPRGIGHVELSSLRPSSARYSFARSSRDAELPVRSEETPGPATYDLSDYPAALSQAAAFVGTAPRTTGVPRPCEQANVDSQDPMEPFPDSSDFRYRAPPSTVFGTEAKDAGVTPDLVRVNPEWRYGQTGPGFIYTPNERKARPSSAPAYSIPRQASRSRVPSPSAAKVSPQSYYAEEPALGVQRDSRRRTRPASSFGRAGRFPATKKAEGQATAECKTVDSSFGGGGSQRKTPCATFGSATRESSARARNCRVASDRGPGERMGPPRMPHPQVAPRKEILRFDLGGPPRR